MEQYTKDEFEKVLDILDKMNTINDAESYKNIEELVNQFNEEKFDKIKNIFKQIIHPPENDNSENDIEEELTNELAERISDDTVLSYAEQGQDIIESLWETFTPERQNTLLKKFIENDNFDLIDSLWRNTNVSVQENNVAEVAIHDFITTGSSEKWKYTREEVQGSKFEEIYKNIEGNHNARLGLFMDSKDTVSSSIPELYNEALETAQKNEKTLIDVWIRGTLENQVDNADYFPKIFADMEKEDIKKIIANTASDVLKANISESLNKIYNNNRDLASEVFEYLPEDVLQDKAIDLIKTFKIDSDKVVNLWKNAPYEIQREGIDDIFDIFKDKGEILYNLYVNLSPLLQKDNPQRSTDLLNEALEWVNTQNPNLHFQDVIFQKTSKDLQEKNRDIIISNLVKMNCNAEVWNAITPSIRDEYIKKLEENSINVWEYISADTIVNDYKLFYEKEFHKEIPQELNQKIQKLYKKNKDIGITIDKDLLEKPDFFDKFTEEQLLKITSQLGVQNYIKLNYSNEALMQGIDYIMQNDSNWVISLNRIVSKSQKYANLIKDISNNKNKEYSDQFIHNMLSIISDNDNYFEINNYEDVLNYQEKKSKICLDILNGKFDNIPEKLKTYNNKNDLYKFALLEYKLGISLEDAKNLTLTYGKDKEKFPDGLNKEYINVLSQICNETKMKKIVDNAIKNDLLYKPWKFDVSSRTVEGKIINMFEDMFNETFYQTEKNESDRVDDEKYIIKKLGNIVEKEKNIAVYRITGDFNLNVRVEGAYSDFIEPDDFNDYFNRPSIHYRGNCESYIGNDSIATAANFKKSVMVGYNHIRKGGLTGMAPYDMSSTNTEFSLYGRGSFVIPKTMKDKTRDNHNEMVKERLVMDEEGNALKNTPDYVVWIEETEDEELGKQKEKNPSWIMSKKLAAQLNIPIVVINREHFAKRETEKIQLMMNLIKGEDYDESKYGKYMSEFEGMSKPQLIHEVITKFENNRVGIRFSKLCEKYFVDDSLSSLLTDIENVVEQMPEEEKLDNLKALQSTLADEINMAKISSDAQKQNGKIFEEAAKRTQEKIYELDGTKDMLKVMNNIEKNKSKEDAVYLQKSVLYIKMLSNSEDLSKNETRLLFLSALNSSNKNDNNLSSKELLESVVQKHSKGNEYTETNKEKLSILLDDALKMARVPYDQKNAITTEMLSSKAARNDEVVEYANSINERLSYIVANSVYGVSWDKFEKDENGIIDSYKTLKEVRKNQSKDELQQADFSEFFHSACEYVPRREHLSVKDNFLKLYEDMNVKNVDITAVKHRVQQDLHKEKENSIEIQQEK